MWRCMGRAGDARRSEELGGINLAVEIRGENRPSDDGDGDQIEDKEAIDLMILFCTFVL
jgi:hypothetical protein